MKLSRVGGSRNGLGGAMYARMLLAGWVFSMSLAAHADQSGVPAPLAAVWKQQRLTFVYMGHTTRYSCEGLRQKMRALLLDLGARRDLQLSVLGCDESAAHFPHSSLGPSLSVVFFSPTLSDPTSKAASGGGLAGVDARYEPFTLTNDTFRDLGLGDCELIEQFARQILPRLAVRELQQDITCLPNQVSG